MFARVTPRSGLAALMCAGLLVVPLVSLRSNREASDGTTLSAASRQHSPGLDERRSLSRASRGGARPRESTTTTEATTTTAAPVVLAAATIAPPTTARVRPRAATATTAKPKPTTTTTAKPRPAPTTTTAKPPAGDSGGSSGASGNTQSGKASWYRADYHAQSPNACAHRTLAKGTVVRITNTANGRTASCTVMDRGPYVDGRIIDLSPHTFSQLADLDEGVIPVRIDW